jgi:hypothetical protein
VSILRVEIRFQDGRKAITNVEGERLLIGSGAHCDIRLPLDQASSEHVSVEVIGDTVRAETRAYNPPPTVNGMPFSSIPLTPDVPLKIGPTFLFISLGDAAIGGPVVQKKKKDETSPLMKLLGLGVLLAGGYMLMDSDTAPPEQAPAQPPELFTAAPNACPQTSPDQARSFAEEKHALADSRRERSPFAPKEGVLAVQLYDLAKVCFERAGDTAMARKAASAATQLRAAITQDFRARRVRLEHMLAVGDIELAKEDVAVLRALTEGRQGPWTTWLRATSQQLNQAEPQ